MRPQAFLLLIIAVPNFLLGSFILFRNIRDKINVFFAAFAYTVGLWALGLAGFILSYDSRTALYWVQLFYIAAALIAVSFFGFCVSFTHRWRKLSLLRFTLLVAPVMAMVGILAFAPETLARSIQYNSWGKSVELNYNFYAVYSIYFAMYVVPGFYVLIRGMRSAHGLERTYLRNIFAGFLVAFVLGMTFNLFFPAVGNYRYIWVGPLFTLFYIAFTSYAIIKHRLFDIRLVVARSLGYALSIFSLALVFAFFAFVAINKLGLTVGRSESFQQGLYTGLAIILAFTFQPLKVFFDKITNKVFFRDTYDPQQLLDALNKVLVSTLDLNILIHSVSDIIADTLKAEFCMLSVKDSSPGSERVAGTIADKDIDQAEALKVRKLLDGYKRKLITTDELGQEDDELRLALRKNNMAVVVQLRESSSKQSHGLGYLVLGTKRSGNPYSSQDTRILEIIADELVIAFQNALRFEEIQNFATTLQEKVDDATHKLRLTNEKLRQLDQTKDDFISMASHQLRTPLTSVKGYVSMVLDEDAGKVSAQQRKLLDQAFISSQRMVYLIADLLNVSRLKTGKFVIEAKPTNLAEVVETELEQLKETAKGRDLKLEFERPKSFPTLNLDETKIRQVIMNFSDNAIYYTPAGGTITVSLVDKPESVELTVADNGIGVPKAEQHHLFTKFYRAGNAKKARPDGTGLGLFMAQKVIVAQGGAIIFHSEENKGSTFGFSFPKAKLLVK